MSNPLFPDPADEIRRLAAEEAEREAAQRANEQLAANGGATGEGVGKLAEFAIEGAGELLETGMEATGGVLEGAGGCLEGLGGCGGGCDFGGCVVLLVLLTLAGTAMAIWP